MEAIAVGVRARLEDRTGFSRKIAGETVEIARAMGVADREIKKWFKERQRLLAIQEKRIQSITKRINGDR